jgi:hypothetical protein
MSIMSLATSHGKGSPAAKKKFRAEIKKAVKRLHGIETKLPDLSEVLKNAG